MYDLIIIGGGPAGMTAGIYACRQGLKTLIITKGFGGQMAQKSVEIENYPGFEKISGFDLISRFENHLRRHEVDIEIDSVIELKKNNNGFLVLTKSNKEFKSKTAVIASGGDPKSTGASGEKEFVGRGVSYCPVCDGPLFSNKDVAVVGGGDAGFESALFLSNYVRKIYILEYDSKIKASPANQALVKNIKNTEIITNASLKEIKGKVLVESIVYNDLKHNKEKSLDVSGVFIEIGYEPATSFILDPSLADFNKKKEIKVNLDNMRTKTPGLYAIGDVVSGKCKQIVVAAADGARAALDISHYLKNE
ncbi:MAG: FAD-dependent oxidoreductase [Candidatus Pacebacteria bacterium]|nr:FAD-dependent oxidoreductase [Candidatus Paceibacterota bacterium]